jgi:hypothetical protein
MAFAVKLNFENKALLKKLSLLEFEPVLEGDNYVIYITELEELKTIYKIMGIDEKFAINDFKKYKRKVDKRERKEKKEKKLMGEKKVEKKDEKFKVRNVMDDGSSKKECMYCRFPSEKGEFIFLHDCCGSHLCSQCYLIVESSFKKNCGNCYSKISLSL